MSIVLPVYGIIGALAGMITLIGINSLMARDPHLLNGEDKTTVDLLQGPRGRGMAVFVVFLVVVLWPVFVVLFLKKGANTDAS